MFRTARIKLTIWYMLITVLVSAFFSISLYAGITRELQHVQRVRVLRQYDNPFIPPSQRFKIVQLEDDTVEELQERIKLNLLIINAVIISLSGLAGYFLAGRTLKPIKVMMEDQQRFITDASHELRTPITALKSAIEVHLRDKKLSLAEARELLKSNLDDVNALQALSDGLIRLAQYDKPNTAVLKPVNLTAVLEESKRRVGPMAKEKQITVDLSVPQAAAVKGDAQTLTELFVILLDNAIKYSPDKTPVSLDAKRSDSHIAIHVRDQGIGIAEEDIPHVFDRFYRADKARCKREVTGYGLGLSIARKIVETHHGAITVESAADVGTVFTVSLPAVKTD